MANPRLVVRGPQPGPGSVGPDGIELPANLETVSEGQQDTGADGQVP
jgi:hypothetical protein